LFSSQTFAANDSEASGVEEIVVTAKKRAESIQDVPVAISALSAGQLERGSVQTILDVAKLVPNVELHEVTQAGGALGASIRGMAFDDLEKTYEPTVGISIDGVFMASNGGAVIE
jgi:iron complex outermembrane receptor protein